jgi:hypothetical protein
VKKEARETATKAGILNVAAACAIIANLPCSSSSTSPSLQRTSPHGFASRFSSQKNYGPYYRGSFRKRQTLKGNVFLSTWEIFEQSAKDFGSNFLFGFISMTCIHSNGRAMTHLIEEGV